MNFWFPSINARGDIASGNRDLWITYADGRAVQIADQGIGPLWLTDDTILYNDHVGHTRLWPGHDVIAPGYNQARTNGRGLWAGNNGTVVELYRERLHLESLNNSSVPRFDGDTLLRIVADPTDDRVKSVYRGTERLVTGAIMDYDGMPLVVTLAPVRSVAK